MRLRPLALCLTLAAAALVARADPAPMYVEVFLRGEKRDVKVAGTLGEHDEARLVIHAPGGGAARELTWAQLTPSSAFTLKSRLIDKASASDWLALGTFGWEHGLEAQAKTAFATARKLDASIAGQADAVLATPSGAKNRPAAAAAPATKPADERATAGAGDAAKPEAGSDAAAAAGDEAAPMQRGYQRGQKIVRYAPPTEDQIAKSLVRSRAFADTARAATKLSLTEIETAHFLIYTDWDPREFKYLQGECEGAYRVVAKQFNQPPEGNVFVGKLPIYMFKAQGDFQKFARQADKFPAPATVLGYFNARDEIGHMAMWKPGIGQGVGAGGNRADAERKWARTLVHEFCHAFVYRYKTDANVPRWLNEGTAELISEMQLPTNNYRAHARTAALQNVDISGLFDDANMPSGFYYPVMMTMVECLTRQDGKKFIAMFDDIKDGTEPEAALKKHFGVDQSQFAEGWKKYARGLK